MPPKKWCLNTTRARHLDSKEKGVNWLRRHCALSSSPLEITQLFARFLLQSTFNTPDRKRCLRKSNFLRPVPTSVLSCWLCNKVTIILLDFRTFGAITVRLEKGKESKLLSRQRATHKKLALPQSLILTCEGRKIVTWVSHFLLLTLTLAGAFQLDLLLFTLVRMAFDAKTNSNLSNHLRDTVDRRAFLFSN